MRRGFLLLCAGALVASSASAQLPGLRKRGPPAPPVLVGIDALRADFAAASGSDTVYFAGDSAVLTVPAKTTLAAQAQWLRQHPEVVVQVEGHGSAADTRDHALAVGARRASEVRDYLILMGVPAAQLSATSWGKERPGAGRTVTVLVR